MRSNRQRSYVNPPFLGGVVPMTLGALGHHGEDASNPVERNQPPGTWKIVIHTMGMKHCSKEMANYLFSVPGRTGRDWASGSMIYSQQGCPIYADMDAFLLLTEPSPYTLRDPAGRNHNPHILGEYIIPQHDGACGFFQYETIEKFSDRLGEMCEDLQRQLDRGALKSARQRARHEMRESRPVLHLAVACAASRHRAEMVRDWLSGALPVLFSDVSMVVARRHHLRPGPHDPRGRCGCHLGRCAFFGGDKEYLNKRSGNLARNASQDFLRIAR